MTYRANGSYLKFHTHTKTYRKPSFIGKPMDAAIMENQTKRHLQDEPAVRSNQNVYDTLAE